MLPTAPIVAFGLTNLPMLGWLAAAATPILIHLWSRRRYRETAWAAMEYLLAALKHSRQRILLEQWLLLLIRTAVVTLVVLAVAEPHLELGGFVSVTGGRTHRMLVIDGSYSMAYKPTDQSRFDRAKQLAARIVEESPQGDGFTLVLMSTPPEVVVGTPALEPGEFLREIDNLTLQHTSIDLPATLAKVEEILIQARREQPRLTQEEIYFLTDLDRVGWLPELSGARAVAEFRERAGRLAESASLAIIDLGQAAAENMALTGVRTMVPYAAVARNLTVEADLKNFGRQARSRQVVELLVDGRRVKHRQVDVPSGGSASVAFSYRFETPGDHVLEIRLEADNLDVDNHRWMVLPVKQFIHVLCVDGRPAGETFGGATGYLEYALTPRRDDPAGTLIRPEVVPESALLEWDLGRYDSVFLCNVAQFTKSEARVLDAYLHSGGSLVFFLGDRVLANRYNRELADRRPGGVCLLPARLGPVVADNKQRLDPLGYRHPIVQAFRGREKAGLLTTPINKYFKLKVPRGSKAKVALAFDGGDPLVVEEPVGRGRVVLVATSADISWTPMPMWPSYVPIVQEVLSYALGGQVRQRNLLVGQPLASSVPSPTTAVSLVVQTPDGHNEPVRLRPEGDYSGWSYAGTMTSGIYTARFGAPVSTSEPFAVNVDTVESDLAQITPEQLREEVWPGVPFLHQTTWENVDEQPVARFQRHGSLSKSLLYLVLGLLLAETFFAWRFGHHTT